MRPSLAIDPGKSPVQQSAYCFSVGLAEIGQECAVGLLRGLHVIDGGRSAEHEAAAGDCGECHGSYHEAAHARCSKYQGFSAILDCRGKTRAPRAPGFNVILPRFWENCMCTCCRACEIPATLPCPSP